MSDRIVISSWALHRTLGMTFPDSPATGRRGPERHGALDPLPLTHIPSALERRGYRGMQICHFHIPSREPIFLAELRSALEDAGVRLHALLIDDGDMTHPEHGTRDLEWIRGWIRVAEELRAERVRVIAGRQPYSAEAVARCITGLRSLSGEAALRVEIENWFELLSTPEAVHQVLDALEGHVGLCADWGNWPRPGKYEGLRSIFPRAETCHAKMEFLAPESIDEEDAAPCLDIALAAKFEGSYVLVNGGVGESEWDALELQREVLVRAL